MFWEIILTLKNKRSRTNISDIGCQGQKLFMFTWSTSVNNLISFKCCLIRLRSFLRPTCDVYNPAWEILHICLYSTIWTSCELHDLYRLSSCGIIIHSSIVVSCYIVRIYLICPFSKQTMPHLKIDTIVFTSLQVRQHMDHRIRKYNIIPPLCSTILPN